MRVRATHDARHICCKSMHPMTANGQARIFRWSAHLFLVAGVALGILPAQGVVFRIGPETWFLWSVALVAYLIARSPRPVHSRPPTHGVLARISARGAYDR